MMRALVVCLALAACGPSPHPRSGVDSGDAVFYLRSNVSDASVYVDSRFVGPVSALRGGIAVNPGKHRLELRRDDYFSRYVDLDLRTGDRKKLLVTLAPVLP